MSRAAIFGSDLGEEGRIIWRAAPPLVRALGCHTRGRRAIIDPRLVEAEIEQMRLRLEQMAADCCNTAFEVQISEHLAAALELGKLVDYMRQIELTKGYQDEP